MQQVYAHGEEEHTGSLNINPAQLANQILFGSALLCLIIIILFFSKKTWSTRARIIMLSIVGILAIGAIAVFIYARIHYPVYAPVPSIAESKFNEVDAGHGSSEPGTHTDEKSMLFGPGPSAHQHEVDTDHFPRIADIAYAAADVSLPVTRSSPETVKVSITTTEVLSELAPGITYIYWTFNDTVPGPFLRVREGDTVEVTITNPRRSIHAHSIDLHAVTGPGGGASITQVQPGETKTIAFKALNPGLYVYHCATANVPMHMTNGMYGMILVEPEEGLPPVDHEYYVMQGEWYTAGKIGDTGFQKFDGDKMLAEQPEYVTFNGRFKALADHPLTAEVGDRVRLFVGNGGVSLISSFHVIGEIFDTVYVEGSTTPIHNVQTTAIPAGGSAIVEFTVDVPGTYVLVDHALARLDRGAWGLLTVTGEDQPEILSAITN